MGKAGGQDGKVDLTGVWQGLYSYQDGKPVPFLATLIDSGPYLTGSTFETTMVGFRPNETASAFIDGTKRAHHVAFVKTYDGAGGWDHSVSYDGAVNGEGTEIEGLWQLPEGMSGPFLMRRDTGKANEVEVKKLAEIEI